MLVLSRKVNEKIRIGDDVSVMVVAIEAGKVRLGIEAPCGVAVHRQEIWQAIQEGKPWPPPAVPAPPDPTTNQE